MLVRVYHNFITRRRGLVVARQVPVLLDYLLLYLNSGMNIQSAFREFGHQYAGPAWQQWRALAKLLDRGVSFEQAAADFVRKFPSPDLKRLFASLLQSQRLGISVGQTLAIHAEMIRGQKKRQAEERAKSAAVKISLPVIFFIFPAVVIVFLGPALLQIGELVGGL